MSTRLRHAVALSYFVPPHRPNFSPLRGREVVGRYWETPSHGRDDVGRCLHKLRKLLAYRRPTLGTILGQCIVPRAVPRAQIVPRLGRSDGWSLSVTDLGRVPAPEEGAGEGTCTQKEPGFIGFSEGPDGFRPAPYSGKWSIRRCYYGEPYLINNKGPFKRAPLTPGLVPPRHHPRSANGRHTPWPRLSAGPSPLSLNLNV
jgi:hypothetical protein